MSERNARMASPNIYCVLNHESEHNRNAKVIHASQSSMIEIPPRNDCPYQQQIKKHEQKQLRKHKRNKVNVTNDIYDVDGVSLTSGDNKPRKRLRSYDFRRFLVPPGPVTALASFPGAGNTWVRHLLEHLFGEYVPLTGFPANTKHLYNVEPTSSQKNYKLLLKLPLKLCKETSHL